MKVMERMQNGNVIDFANLLQVNGESVWFNGQDQDIDTNVLSNIFVTSNIMEQYEAFGFEHFVVKVNPTFHHLFETEDQEMEVVKSSYKDSLNDKDILMSIQYGKRRNEMFVSFKQIHLLGRTLFSVETELDYAAKH